MGALHESYERSPHPQIQIWVWQLNETEANLNWNSFKKYQVDDSKRYIVHHMVGIAFGHTIQIDSWTTRSMQDLVRPFWLVLLLILLILVLLVPL